MRRFASRPTRAALVVVVLLLGGLARADEPPDFVSRHWRRPLAPQGAAPPAFGALEASLRPEACGACHAVQFADWRASLHARSMGPGVTGQLVEMLEADTASALSCFTCHAPLAEQAPLVRNAGRFEKNLAYDPGLSARGVACAACHVRGHERFGPPRRDGSLADAPRREPVPHGGVTRVPAFLRSEFCRDCHQFDARGFALNGKLLQDTYREWQASPSARAGVQCQDCHMPDRRHLWRGIHDPDMVRSGVTVSVAAGEGAVLATLVVESTRVGHAFPTYVTPRVVLRAELHDAAGAPVPGSRQEHVIERHVALDLSREISDTRLGPGERATLEYRPPSTPDAVTARLSVVVFPDAFYERFFETLLAEGAGRGMAEIREALAETRRSAFTIFERDVPVRRPAVTPSS